jgi:hypothetical protein
MIVETEFAPDGVTLVRTVNIEPDGTGTVTFYDPDGSVASTVALTGVEVPPTFPPLDDTGALATLLAVNGVITVQEAANIEHVPVAHIEHEALAWEAASNP